MASTVGSTTTDASGNSYKVVLADDFSNGYLTSNWGYAFNGGTYWNGAFTWSSSDVAVRSGEMQVTDTRQANGSWTAGGFSSFKAGQTITYGTVEFDARVEAAQGTQAAILMWPASDVWPRDGEIDILEAPKNQAMHSSHWEGSDGSHQYSSIFSSIDPSQTHHYKMIWLPSVLTIQVDGRTVAEWTDPAAIPDTAMGFGAMGYVAANGEDWLGGAPNGSTPSVVTTHIDNVVMSQWTGGGNTPTTPSTPTPTPEPEPGATPVTTTIGSGSDSLVLRISQDAYQGSAQYTVSVDGKQIGGTLTAGASHAAGQDDVITVKGDWAAGSHKVTVSFLNDLYGGTSATDRNLHVDGIAFNGTAVANATADLNSNGAVDLAFAKAAPPVVVPTPATPVTTTIGSGSDSLVLRISQDAYQGSAQYTVSVDGKQIGGTLTAGASHAAGQDDTITVKGDWAAGDHKVTVTFLNDLYGGTSATDRNLHIDGIAFNGAAVAAGTADLKANGPVDFAFAKAAPPVVVPEPAAPVATTIGSGSDALVLRISQDAYQGSAQYTVSVDGKQIGGTLTASAWHSVAQDDTVTIKGDWAAGDHKVTVTFINDAWGGSSATDRNLHVDGVAFNGTAVANATADLNSNGAVDFAFAKAAPPVVVPEPAPEPAPTTGTAAIPARFGAPGEWGQDSLVWIGQLDFGGTRYQTFGAKPTWGDLSTVLAAPKTWDAAWDTHIAVDNFVTARLDLHAAGTRALDVMVVSAKGGTVILGDGNDHVTWVAHSDAAGAGNAMSIETGGGDDRVTLTAAGLSPLADYDRTGNGSLYDASYDGTGSTASVRLGGGHDTVTTEGGVRLVLYGGSGFATATGGSANDVFYAGTGGGDFTGGAGRDQFVFDRGDGHVVIEDFTSGADKLRFNGMTKADIHTTAATEGGVAGLLITYDSAGDSVFLAHVTKVAAFDMLFA